MITPQDLAKAYARNTYIIEKQAEGLSHADSLLALPFRGNCFNWVLGHILGGRDRVLKALGETPLLSEAETERYNRGSDPITEGEEHVAAFERLMANLKTTQERIEAGLNRITPEDLSVVRNEKTGHTVGQYIHFQYFHDTYHTGQTEALRQLAGKNDQVI